MNLDAAKRFLCRRLGLQFEDHAETRLRSALQSRIAATGQPGLADYLARLAGDAVELHALINLLTVKESHFFREPQHLRLLTEHLAPLLLGEHADGAPVRILSVGCAAGEEPYSIAIVLRERWGDAAVQRFRIEAADLDPEALALARAGRYRPWSLRGLDPTRATRWFNPAPDGTRELAREVRDAVAFRTLNLVADPLPDDLRGQDLIFYRNLSIYFDAPTREAVLRRLRSLLCPGGYLIVGTAETLANDRGLLQLREHAGVWYFAHPGAAERGAAPGRAPAPPTGRSVSSATDNETAGRGARCDTASPMSVQDQGGGSTMAPGPFRKRAGAGITVVGPPPATGAPSTPAREARRPSAALEPPGDALAAPAELLPTAHRLAESGDPEGAAAAAWRALEADPWSVEARVLLGHLARLAGDLPSAAEHLRRAVYACPDHWPAHFELAECRAAAGQDGAARREYRIVLRLLDQARTEHARTAAPGTLAAPLPVADLRLLCRARLARLGEPA